MSKKTKIIIVVIIAIVLIYFAYVKLFKTTTSATNASVKASIDCTKYWSLNSIDKQYCKNNGMAPVDNSNVNTPLPPIGQTTNPTN